MKKEEAVKECGHKIYFNQQLPLIFVGVVGDIAIFLCEHCNEHIITPFYHPMS